MSFSIGFVASTKSKALAALSRQSPLPSSVRNFIATAIEALPAATEDSPRAISVHAHGHLCDGSASYGLSQATIEVKPIVIDG